MKEPCPDCGEPHSPVADLAQEMSRVMIENMDDELLMDGPSVTAALIYIAAITLSGCPIEEVREACIEDVEKRFRELVASVMRARQEHTQH